MVDKTNKQYLLTCFHVACSTLFKNKQYDAAGNTIVVRAPASKASQGLQQTDFNVVEGKMTPEYEYALIEYPDGFFKNEMPGFQFEGCHSIDDIQQNFAVAEPLACYGAASHATDGFFLSYHTKLESISQFEGMQMSGLIQATALSTNGDSGAPVINTNTKKLVGYVIGGDGASTFILPFAALEQIFITPNLKT